MILFKVSIPRDECIQKTYSDTKHISKYALPVDGGVGVGRVVKVSIPRDKCIQKTYTDTKHISKYALPVGGGVGGGRVVKGSEKVNNI